jgi:hypothetical protein
MNTSAEIGASSRTRSGMIGYLYPVSKRHPMPGEDPGESSQA